MSTESPKHQKYIKLWSLLGSRLSSPISNHLDNLIAQLKPLIETTEDQQALQRELVRNLIEEYFRFEGRPLEGGASQILVSFVMQLIGGLDL